MLIPVGFWRCTGDWENRLTTVWPWMQSPCSCCSSVWAVYR